MTTFIDEGSQNPNAVVVATWQEINVTPDGGSPAALGTVMSGAFTFGKEYYKHQDNSFPRKTDLVICIAETMMFAGELHELHSENVALVLGKDFEAPGNILYFGALQTPIYFTLDGLRKRPDGEWFQVHMNKCISVEPNVEFGSNGNEAVAMKLTAEALDDSAGDFGGSTTGPLGWMYLPTKAES